MAYEFAEGKAFAFTKYKYIDGELVGKPDDEEKTYASGYIEKLNTDGEWELYGDTAFGHTSTMIPGNSDVTYAKPLDGESVRLLPLHLSWYSPGKYRVTQYFRDCISTENSHYATGDELYSVSYRFDVPDYSSNRRFDVLYVERDDRDGEYCISFALRANEGEASYRAYHHGVVLRRVENGRLIDMGYTEKRLRDDSCWNRYDCAYGIWDVSDAWKIASYTTVADLAPDEEYRLTFFSENDDGSEEQWEFVLPVLPDYPPPSR